MLCDNPYCGHEWQAADTEPCWACGVEGNADHEGWCAVTYCDWCGGTGYQIAQDWMDVDIDLEDFKVSMEEGIKHQLQELQRNDDNA